MSFLNWKDNQYIILKEGYNKTLIAGMIVVIGIIIFLLSTKLWLPDGRDKMTLNVKKEMSFKDTIVNVNEEYYWNKDKQIAEIHFVERCINVNADSIKCTVKNQDKTEMPISLIKGNAVSEEEGSLVTETDYILQFAMPRNTYYLTFEIEKGGLKYDFSIDYRDFKIKDIVELNSTYLIDVQNLNTDIEQLERKKKELENELNIIMNMTDEEKLNEQEHMKELNYQIEKIENDIKVNQQKIKQLNEGIE